MSMGTGRIHLARVALLILGLFLMVGGAFTPTVGRYITGTVINVAGGTPTSISLSIASVDYVQCPSCTSSYQELALGNTLQLGGRVNVAVANLQIQSQVSVNGQTQYNLPSYTTDSQGYYGALQNNGQPSNPTLIQLKADGFYVNGYRWSNSPSAFTVGDTLTITTLYTGVSPTLLSNTATVKIIGSGVAPTGVVTLKGGDGQIFTLNASSNVQTKSPLCFRVAITQGVDNVQSVDLKYWHYNVQELFTQALTRNSPICGLTSDQNSWYGQLNLQPGVWVVKTNVTPKTGQPVVLLSLLGYFDIPTPIPDISDYYVGSILLILGAALTISGAFMPMRRLP